MRYEGKQMKLSDPDSAAIPDRLLKAGAAHELLSGLDLPDQDFRELLQSRLDEVEQRLHACIKEAGAPFLIEVAGHVLTNGGKRLRPLLALLGAEFGDRAAEGVTEAATVVELVHAASLYHDDVVDRAGLRHGVVSANVRWGDRTAVRAGDWMLARAAELSSQLVPEAIRLHVTTADRLVRGQMQEMLGPEPDEDRLAYYYAVVAGKSGSLISASLALGAFQAGADGAAVAVLKAYGEHLGVAFQIADDIHDLTAPGHVSGKQRGQDLCSGVSSLPVLLALRDGEPRRAEELGTLLVRLADRPNPGGPDHRRALRLIASSPGVPGARRVLRERLALARRALASLPPGPAILALGALCDIIAPPTERHA